MIQIPLKIQLKESATFSSYYSGHNREAVQTVRRLCETGEHFIYLWGAFPGVGRTHLLQAAAHAAVETGKTAFYLPCQEMRKMQTTMQEMNAFGPESLKGLHRVELVCLDDVDLLLGNAAWEVALFHLFNHIYEKGSRLLLSARRPPRLLNAQLEDLKSRLSSGVIYQLHPLSDEEKIEALQQRAIYCGLQLDRAVAQFLVRHLDRHTAELFHALEHLDKSSLAEQRRLTIPFVKKVLGV